VPRMQRVRRSALHCSTSPVAGIAVLLDEFGLRSITQARRAEVGRDRHRASLYLIDGAQDARWQRSKRGVERRYEEDAGVALLKWFGPSTQKTRKFDAVTSWIMPALN